MKNIKGFTLVEVLATIVILGILLLIAVPSVSKLQETSNIRQIEADAKIFVELVRQKIESDTSYDGSEHTLELKKVDMTKLSSSEYDKDSSFVKAYNCDYQASDVYTCTMFEVLLENDNYKANGTVDDTTVNISVSKK